jgi:hypothetical protein
VGTHKTIYDSYSLVMCFTTKVISTFYLRFCSYGSISKIRTKITVVSFGTHKTFYVVVMLFGINNQHFLGWIFAAKAPLTILKDSGALL